MHLRIRVQGERSPWSNRNPAAASRIPLSRAPFAVDFPCKGTRGHPDRGRSPCRVPFATHNFPDCIARLYRSGWLPGSGRAVHFSRSREPRLRTL